MGRAFEADSVGRNILLDAAFYPDRSIHESDCSGGGRLPGGVDDDHFIDYLSQGQLLCDGNFYSIDTFMYYNASTMPVYRRPGNIEQRKPLLYAC